MVAYKRGRHLDTAVGGHTIELGFITAAIVAHAFVEPQARLYSSVVACKVVAVFFQKFSGGIGYRCHFRVGSIIQHNIKDIT